MIFLDFGIAVTLSSTVQIRSRNYSVKIVFSKVIMQGKLIAVAYTQRTYWKPVLSGQTLEARMGASVFVQYPRMLKAFNFDNFENSHNSFL